MGWVHRTGRAINLVNCLCNKTVVHAPSSLLLSASVRLETSNMKPFLIRYNIISFCLKVVTHPSTNPTRPGLTSELLCLLSLFLAKIFSQTSPSPPSDFLLSVFSLYPCFASYCEYSISSFIYLFLFFVLSGIWDALHHVRRWSRKIPAAKSV